MIALIIVVAAGAVGCLALGGCLLVGLYPLLPTDLGGVPNLDRSARRVRIPVGPHDAIDGWLLRGVRPATIIIFHGYGRTHHRAWRYGAFLQRAGFHVLAVDFRSGRYRGRKPTTLGHHEIDDAEATLDWVRRDLQLAGHRIGVLGESLGGAVSLLLAARHPEIESLVVDGAFASGSRALEDSCERWAGIPAHPSAAILRSVTRAVTGRDPGVIDALHAARRLADRPIFFIHGMDDDRLAPQQARDLWSAAGSKDALWLIPEAGHNQGWERHRSLYEERVIAFFTRTLLSEGAELASGLM